jgi:uncharacterized protein (DUF362 family)/Pyruvate/2-oxoacid:ferredoxin oxidoreductase delta subunit
MGSTVHLVQCPDYDRAAVRAAVRQCWQALLPPDFISPGMTVLLKPNVINDMAPERAVCTHPEVVRAVAELALEAGAQVVVADQPGYALTEEPSEAFARTGMLQACSDLPVTFELLSRGGYEDVAPPQPYQLKTVQYSSRVLAADRVLNLCKAKTHNQTLIPCAIKNMFGAMSPRQRIEAHLLGRYWALSEAVVDCYAARPPDLNLVDAVQVMEGMGPTQGQPRHMGLIAASTEGAALDAVIQQALGYDLQEVATTVAAHNVGLGEIHAEHITLSGIPPADVALRIRRSPAVHIERLGPLVRLLKGLVTARPRVDRRRCKSCGACAGICPGQAIVIEDYARIDGSRCVECFCCQEACPFDAITLGRSPLYAVAQRLQRLLSRTA